MMRVFPLAMICLISIVLGACNFPLTPQSAAPAPGASGATPAAGLPVVDDYLSGARVVSFDPFDSLRNWQYEPADGTLVNGVFQMTGTSFWHSHLSYRKKFSSGDALMITFDVQRATAQSEFVFVSGDWLTDSFRQFGVYNSSTPQADLFQGRRDLGGGSLLGNLRLLPGVSYALLLAVGPHGHMEAVLYDPAAPAQRAVYDLLGDPTWVDRKWTFMPKANVGETLYIDNFYRLAFTDIK